ncbi:MAG: arginine decarboxylase, partial [Sulfurimonas sp.]|nr:arginine decarboxylase [Sulfurimonas sp.]
MNTYGLDIWSDDNFIIHQDEVLINYKSKPSLLEITNKIRSEDVRGPIILRFPHLIKKQINKLYNSFNASIKENNYKGDFQAVFPLKVNQFPFVVQAITNEGRAFSYGLEAGSKAELILAMSKSINNSPITVNGFKDKEMVMLAFIAKQSGHNITITIEGLGELRTIIELVKESSLKVPNIGLRVRLHSKGSGAWEKSAGMDAKFGLTATEILEATKLLRSANLLHKFTMIHFHIG